MKICYCDVCGVPVAGGAGPGLAKLMSLCDVEDVCDSCAAAGTGVGVKELLLEAWRAAARRDNGAAEEERNIKRAARDELLRYRDQGGLGCLERLANELGGGWNAMELRRLIAGELTLTADEWRRIGETAAGMMRKDEEGTPPLPRSPRAEKEGGERG